MEKLKKRPSTKKTWKQANGPAILKKMGLVGKKFREENERIAKTLTDYGYEFAWAVNVYTYEWDFAGYTWAFVKKMSDRKIYFSWHWTNEEAVYWVGEMFSQHRYENHHATKHLQPVFCAEVSRITTDTLNNLPTYEAHIHRSISDIKLWGGMIVTF